VIVSVVCVTHQGDATRLVSVLATLVNSSSYKFRYSVYLKVSTFCSAHGHSTLLLNSGGECRSHRTSCNLPLLLAIVYAVKRVVCHPTKHLAAPAGTVRRSISSLKRFSVSWEIQMSHACAGIWTSLPTFNTMGCTPEDHDIPATNAMKDVCGWTNLHQPRTRGGYCTLPLDL